MLRIRFVTPYFPPEVGATQTRVHELCVRLVRAGHEVEVLTTFPNWPSGVVLKEWRGLWYHRAEDQGIRVHRVRTYATPNRGVVKRILGQLSFAISATLHTMLLRPCDLQIVESPPLFTGLQALATRAIRRTPYVFTVADLWPASAIEMGILRNPIAIRLARWLESKTYTHAVAILALTRGIRDAVVEEIGDASKVILFRGAVDADYFRPESPNTAVRRAWGITAETFVVLYAGTLGAAHNVDVLLHAAAMFQNEKNQSVFFVLAGEGAELVSLRSLAERLALQNVLFLQLVAKSKMPELLNAADCVAVTLRDLQIFQGALPSKMFEGMACAKPILLAVKGEAAKLIEEAECGIAVTPEDAHSVHDGLLELERDRARARHMGEKGRAYVIERFSRDVRATELMDVLHRVARNPEQARSGRSSLQCPPSAGQR